MKSESSTEFGHNGSPEDTHAGDGCVLAIDPGRAKCGVAVVSTDSRVLFRSVIPTTDLAHEVTRIISVYEPSDVVLGNGTGSSASIELIRAAAAPTPVSTVDESYTSEEARKRFVSEVPAHGLQRLLPASLRTPQSPYDDYVAVILAERFVSKSR
jgi:RNase H-fold protein (predicted Holliday junction resolvase)